MLERPDDLVRLQAAIDRSYDRAGDHLLEVHAPERRLDARGLSERLTGMRLLTLATSTRDGRPITGPVDGIFYRGRFHFGSSPASLRFRHIRERPQVSATHLPGEELAVTVHGTAEALDLTTGKMVPTGEAAEGDGAAPAPGRDGAPGEPGAPTG